MEIKSYEDLQVWQEAMRLVELVYVVQRRFPKEEVYGLGDQVRRAAVSIPSNIAEGFGRDTKSDFIHFLIMARGSLFELRTQLEIAHRVGYIEDVSANSELSDVLASVGRMINAFVSKLRASAHK